MTSHAALGSRVSTPVIVFAVIGGYLGQAIAQGRHLPAPAHLRGRRVAGRQQLRRRSGRAAGHERRDARAGRRPRPRQRLSDARSREGVRAQRDRRPGGGRCRLTRQYYLRVCRSREGSPAAKAGLAPATYIRAIDGKPTRDMSAFEGARLLSGAPGSKVALLGHSRQRRRAARGDAGARARHRPDVTSRMADPRRATCASPSSPRTRRRGSSRPSTRWPRRGRDALRRRSARHRARRSRRRHRGGAPVRGDRHAHRQADQGRARRRGRAGWRRAITAPVALLVDQGTRAPPKCSPRRSTATSAPSSSASARSAAPRASSS